MANTAVVTASGIVKNASGNLYNINVTQVGTGASSWVVYDNTAASGRIIAQGDGFSQQSFSVQSPSSGVQCGKGIYVAVAGTTAPTVVVVYE